MSVPFQPPFREHRFDQPLLFLPNFIFHHEVRLWELVHKWCKIKPRCSPSNGCEYYQWLERRLQFLMLWGTTMDKAMSFHNKKNSLPQGSALSSVRGESGQRNAELPWAVYHGSFDTQTSKKHYLVGGYRPCQKYYQSISQQSQLLGKIKNV